MIYFITQEDRYVKIGTAKNPKARAAGIQTGNPHKIKLWFTIGGGRPEEDALHKTMPCVHKRGEWFELTDGVRECLIELRDVYDGYVWDFIFDMPWYNGGRDEYMRCLLPMCLGERTTPESAGNTKNY